MSSDLEDLKFNKKIDPVEIASLWTANNDARGYALIGDPAVRLRVSDSPPGTLSLPETITIATETKPNPNGAVNNERLDATLEKLQQQLLALAETVQELRNTLKQ